MTKTGCLYHCVIIYGRTLVLGSIEDRQQFGVVERDLNGFIVGNQNIHFYIFLYFGNNVCDIKSNRTQHGGVNYSTLKNMRMDHVLLCLFVVSCRANLPISAGITSMALGNHTILFLLVK